MPSAAARQVYEDQIPQFMSVFDLDPETMADQDTVTIVNPKMVDNTTVKTVQLSDATQPPLRSTTLLPDPMHKHTNSTSTQASESADSSPTTTLSTTDSSPLSDPSPSSSPDSPVNLIPLNNYPSSTFAPTQAFGAPPVPSIPESVPTLNGRPMTSPSPRRPRNMKGLSIQPPFVASNNASNAPPVEPSSPSFIKPQMPPMRRKPSQLSLKTSSSDLKLNTLEVPQSPSMPPSIAPILQRRALKHSTSSPHMLSSLKSSTFGPAGGMSFPKVLERNENGLSELLRPMKSSMNTHFDSSITDESGPIRSQMAKRSDYEPFPEPGNNEDLKSPSYPKGPIAIYGDNVFLYLEPTAEEAARFDVVINVAREVENPFEPKKQPEPSVPVRSFKNNRLSLIAESPCPESAVSTASFASAFEFQPSDDRLQETPTTPKAGNPFKQPEYIHIEWDHHTDIAPDLKGLCETIKSRTDEGKKVLIHCQQGASRSASLIIAYGMFQNPELSVNDAYYKAQARSRWISPNMKLMYSLQDFHKEISKKPTPVRTGRSPTKHRLTLSADHINLSAKEPKTAPLPSTEDEEKSAEEQKSPTRPRGNSTPMRPTAATEPASEPKDFGSSRIEVDEPTPTATEPKLSIFQLPQRPKSSQGKRESSQLEAWFKPPPTPGFSSHGSFGMQSLSFPRFTAVEQSDEDVIDSPSKLHLPGSFPVDDDEPLMSPRAETITHNPLHEQLDHSGLCFVESPPTPQDGLFSPRASSFTRNSLFPLGLPTETVDPRSPPMKGESPIVRSIDDLI